MSTSRRVCTFFLNDLFFGLGAERVQEMSRDHKITPVPLAPAIITGVINLRGRISTAINLREMLAMEPQKSRRRPMNIVMRTENNELINLLVDSVDDIIEVEEGCFEYPPETLSEHVRGLIHGAYKLENRLLLLLDDYELLNRLSEITKLKNKSDKFH